MRSLLAIYTISLLIAFTSATLSPTDCTPNKKHIISKENQCAPESTFTAPDGCNICTCTCSGQKNDAICTEKAECCKTFTDICFSGTYFFLKDSTITCECPSSQLQSEATNCVALSAPLPGQKKACIPGTKYTTGSFLYCDCPESGLQRDVDDFSLCGYIDPFPIPCGKCTPGAIFKRDDGSKCTCPPTGFKDDTTSCYIEPNVDCVPGETFIRVEDGFTCECPSGGVQSETTSCYIESNICE